MIHHTKVLLSDVVAERLAGNWRSAINLCELAFQKSVAARDTESIIEAVLTTGHCYRECGDAELAEEYYALGFTLANLQGDARRASSSLNGLGIVFQEHGKMDQAEAVYTEAHQLAVQAGDVARQGHIQQNLGTLANTRGNLQEAVRFYEASLLAHDAVGNERGMAGVLNNLGMLYTDLRQYDRARDCLDRALALFNKVDDIISVSIVRTNLTELFIELGHLDQARVSCDDAFEIASHVGDQSGKSEALKFYGVIYRETRKFYLAESHLRDSIEIAVKHNLPLYEAESQRELALVLRAQGRNREALEALNRAHALFSSLQAKHEQADINERFSQLESDFLSLVRLWGESIEAKDRYTRGHCQRVADYACHIAERAGITEREMVWFRMGAFLHDVGKTEVPEEILNKPGRLTDEERAIIEQHTVIGDEMLSSIEFPWDIRPMVRWHHERWDGGGYPDGLAGEQIPVTARILRLADIFDALTTTRSYREPLSPEKALQIMRDDHGSFDPELFEIFCELFPTFSGMVGGEDSARNGEEPARESEDAA